VFEGASIHRLLQRAMRELDRLRRQASGGGHVARRLAGPFPYKVPGVSIFKRAGRRTRTDRWLVSYKDPVTEKRKTKTASADVETTFRFARGISERLDMHRLGQTDARAEKISESEQRPLLGVWAGGEYFPGHLDAYRDWMRAKGRSRKQVHEVCTRARKMIRLCRFNTILDVAAEQLELAVGECLRDRRGKSLKTCNDYLKSLAQLCRWMTRPKIGRARMNPLAEVEKYNAAEDPRHPRRPLTREQFLKVLDDTRDREPYKRMTGVDRAMYYLVKVQTGIRNEEAASLTPASFQLDVDPPQIVVAAAYSKHRRNDELRILPELAEQLRAWLLDKAAGEPAFPIDDKPYLMWKADLEASGIPYCESGRYADLYALRHAFATWLAESGASIKTVQQLMRHGDIRLTARYMHASVYDEAKALGNLPMPSEPLTSERQRQLMLFTGTHGPASAQRSKSSGAQQHPQPAAAPSGSRRSSKKTQAPEAVGFMRIAGSDGELITRRSTEPKVAGSSPARCDSPKPATDQVVTPPPAPATAAAVFSRAAPGAARPGSAPAEVQPLGEKPNSVSRGAGGPVFGVDGETRPLPASIDLLKLLDAGDPPVPQPKLPAAISPELAQAMLALLARHLNGGAS
jgi:integrase